MQATNSLYPELARHGENASLFALVIRFIVGAGLPLSMAENEFFVEFVKGLLHTTPPASLRLPTRHDIENYVRILCAFSSNP